MSKPSKTLDLLFPRRVRHREVIELLNKIMATQEELAADIRQSNAQIRKAVDEVLAKIAALEETVRNNPPAQSIVDAVADLKVASQAADDVIPDAPTPTP